MSREDSTYDGVFDGLLGPEEEAFIDELMNELSGDTVEFDYDAWQHVEAQEDIEMTDAFEQSNTARPSAHQPSVVDLTHEQPVIDLTQETTSSAQESLTQQLAAVQPTPSSQDSTSTQQPTTTSQPVRTKWKVRVASNATPTLPRGTWDIPVLTCVDEIKRPDGEFRLHADHTGNQKCAAILKAIFPEKAFASYTIEVLASRVSSVWNDRDRGKKEEWTRVREMRAEDEEMRKDMREKIQATGLV